MLLPRGVTGFWSRGDVVPPTVDLKAFLADCHAATRQVGGAVRTFTNPNSGHNYAVCVLALSQGDVAVLLNAHAHLVAFAIPPAPGQVVLEFLDVPDLAEAFTGFGRYTLVPKSELDGPVTADTIGALSKAERQQVAYWAPVRVGDVAFNWWD